MRRETKEMDDFDTAVVAAAEAPQGSVEALPAPAPVSDTGVALNEPQRGNREARYRVERNEARTALEVVNGRLAALQRAEVERLAAGKLSQPHDLFSLSGNDLADYLDEHGAVDVEKVVADVAAVLAERPGLLRNAPAHDPSQGLGGTPNVKPKPSWDFLLQGQ